MREYLTLPLSLPRRGVNRLDVEAGEDQASEARNVIFTGAGVRRRQAYSSLAHAAPHLMPGTCYVIAQAGDSGYTHYASGVLPALSQLEPVMWFGYTEAFTGLLLEHPEGATSPPGTRNAKVSAYLTPVGAQSAVLTALRSFDRTKGKKEGTDTYSTLYRRGVLSWRFPSGFEHIETTLDGVSRFWVKVELIDPETGLAAQSGTTEWRAPGVRPVSLVAINGLFPVQLRGADRLVVCSDRQDRRGPEHGAQVGVSVAGDPTETLRLVLDEGAGIVNRLEWPTWDDPLTGAGSYIGANGRLSKLDESYDWWARLSAGEPPEGQFVGAVMESALQSTGGTSSSFTFSGLEAEAQAFEHCILRCTTGSGGGIAAGQQRRILTSEDDDITTIPFDAAPDGINRFAILRPPVECVIDGVGFTIDSHDTTDGAHQIALVEDADQYTEPQPADFDVDLGNDSGVFVRFEMARELRWSIDSGERWRAAVDSTTGRLILANGRSGMLVYDGRSLRPLAANYDSDRANFYVGRLPVEESEEPSETSLSHLRQRPPRARIVVDYMGRLVVVEDDDKLIWSAPGGFNDIWPLLYTRRVRDSDNAPISALATLYDKLVVATPTSLFAGGPPDSNGMFTVAPISQGIGFASHESVVRVVRGASSALVGLGRDAPYLFNGAEPQALLESWRSLVDGGLNEGRLHLSVGTASHLESRAYFAVPSRGSAVNDLILVWDWLRGGWWVWEAPRGVSSMATARDQRGRERILIGTDDGHVQELTEHDTDDGDPIEGWWRTPVARVAGPKDASILGVRVAAKRGGDLRLTAKVYLDRREVASGEAEFETPPAGGESFWDNGSPGWDSMPWQGYDLPTTRVPLPEGLIGDVVQIEISGSYPWEVRALDILARQRSESGRLA